MLVTGNRESRLPPDIVQGSHEVFDSFVSPDHDFPVVEMSFALGKKPHRTKTAQVALGYRYRVSNRLQEVVWRTVEAEHRKLDQCARRFSSRPTIHPPARAILFRRCICPRRTRDFSGDFSSILCQNPG